MIRSLVFAVLLLYANLILSELSEAAPLAKIDNCTLIHTAWADGDSFQIQIPETEGHKARNITVRLYGADCIEAHVSTETDARRLRAQRRYFGITGYGGDPAKSIELAKDLGKAATRETQRLLAKPFTVYTSFASARGNPKFKRVYAFIVTNEGKDLACELVTNGHARAFGVYRSTWDKQDHDEYRAHMKDLELRAARESLGAWKFTNWETLLEERRQQRAEERELEIATNNAPPANPIHINKASINQLTQIPGIGESLANRIIEARPYKTPDDLLQVPKIGPKTLEKLKPFLIFPDQP